MRRLRRRLPELLRGTLLGLLALGLVCALGWGGCPSPPLGESRDAIRRRWGPPTAILRPPGRPGPEASPERWLYRCGLFGTSTVILSLDAEGRLTGLAQAPP